MKILSIPGAPGKDANVVYRSVPDEMFVGLAKKDGRIFPVIDILYPLLTRDHMTAIAREMDHLKQPLQVFLEREGDTVQAAVLFMLKGIDRDFIHGLGGKNPLYNLLMQTLLEHAGKVNLIAMAEAEYPRAEMQPFEQTVHVSRNLRISLVESLNQQRANPIWTTQLTSVTYGKPTLR